MSAVRKPMKPAAASSTRSGSGRPAGSDSGRAASNTARSEQQFNSKEISDFLSSRVAAAIELNRKWSELPEDQRDEQPPVLVYQGEQRAWGSTRPFNPVKDDFLQLVEIAIDSFKQNSSENHSQQE